MSHVGIGTETLTTNQLQNANITMSVSSAGVSTEREIATTRWDMLEF
jgi:hypothetical protein